MSPLAFDTHRAVKALCEAGAAEPLAEAFVETIGDAITGNVATKADIAASEAALRAEVAEGRTEVANVWAELKPTSVWSGPKSAIWRRGCIGSCGSWRPASSG